MSVGSRMSSRTPPQIPGSLPDKSKKNNYILIFKQGHRASKSSKNSLPQHPRGFFRKAFGCQTKLQKLSDISIYVSRKHFNTNVLRKLPHASSLCIYFFMFFFFSICRYFAYINYNHSNIPRLWFDASFKLLWFQSSQKRRQEQVTRPRQELLIHIILTDNYV